MKSNMNPIIQAKTRVLNAKRWETWEKKNAYAHTRLPERTIKYIKYKFGNLSKFMQEAIEKAVNIEQCKEGKCPLCNQALPKKENDK